MNKHNIIELFEYKENKQKVNQEKLCYEFLDSLTDRIKMTQTYAKNYKEYIEMMVRDGHIKQSFASNLNQQVDMLMQEFAEEIRRFGLK